MIFGITVLLLMSIGIMYCIFRLYRLNRCHVYMMKVLRDIDIKNRQILTEAKIRIESGEIEGVNLVRFTHEVVERSNVIFNLFKEIPDYNTMVNKFWIPIENFVPKELKEKLYNEPQ